MAITPSGTPAWTRTATHEDYGGDLNKTNYLSRGVIDALTDVGADELCRIAADLEACVRMSPFASLSVTCRDSVSAAPLVNSALLQTGVRSTSYDGASPPTGYPSASRVSNGAVRVTFPASFADAYGVTAAWAPTQVLVSARGGGYSEAFGASYSVSANVLSAWAYDQTTGNPASNATIDIAVW